MERKRFAFLSALSMVGALVGFFSTSATPAVAACYRQNWVATSCGGCFSSSGSRNCLNYAGTCMPIMDPCKPGVWPTLP